MTEATERNQSNDKSTQRTTTYDFTTGDVQDVLEDLDELDYAPGRTPTGERIHVVDFDTNSILALGRDEPDKLLCGQVGDYDHAEDADASPTSWCRTCLAKLIHDDDRLLRVGRAGA